MNSSGIQLRLTQKVFIILSLVAVVQSAFLFSIAAMVDNTAHQLEAERDMRSVVGTLGRLSNLIQAITICVLKVVSLSTSTTAPPPQDYWELLNVIPKELNKLKNLAKKNPRTSGDLAELIESYENGLDLLSKLNENRGHDRKLHYLYLYRLQEASNGLTGQLGRFESRYQRQWETTSADLESQSNLLFTLSITFGILVMLAVAILGYFFFVKGITSRLKTISDNTINVALGKPLLEPVSGNDELATLDQAFREMVARLEEFQSKERIILENAADFICSMNEKGVFVDVNKASSALWGYAPDELIGRRISSLLLAKDIDNTLAAIETAYNDSVPISIENRLKHKDGEYIDLAWSVQPGAPGEAMVCTAHDITERNRMMGLIRESEEQLSAIIDSLPVAVVVCDEIFCAESVNPMTAKMFQYQPGELLGKSFNILLSGTQSSTREGARQLDSLMSVAQRQPVELQAFRHDGSQIAVSLNVSSYRDRGVERYLATLQDITARREIELVKQDFVAMISHDLRSPLTSLHGTLGMMAAGVGMSQNVAETNDEKQGEHEILTEAERTVGKLVSLINDFLDLEKIESGRFAFELQLVLLSDLIEKSIEKVTDTPETAPAIKLVTANSGIELRVDRERVELAMCGLMASALRFNTGEKEVRIKVEKYPQDVKVIFSTPACKVPADVKESCMERYSMMDLPSDDTWTASELSLALARATALAHNGTIGIDSTGDLDSFWIRLPIASQR